MHEKQDADDKNDENDDCTGFRINLPFGLGWLRGDGTHLSLLMPVIRWMVILSTILYLILRLLEEAKQT